MTSKAKQAAIDFIESTKRAGFTIDRASGCVVTISKRIVPNDADSFRDADMSCPIYDLPQTSPGSTWGTDGGSMGGHSAMIHGVYRMNRSGVSRRIVSALSTMI